MTSTYYKDINLHNLKSVLFENLQYYDDNYLDKEINLGQILLIEKQTIASFVEQYNNKIVTPENINQIIKLGEFLLIDRKDIQQFIIENSIPTVDNYIINNELGQLYNLPSFMTNNHFKTSNLIIESVKLGLINWIKFGLREKLYWDNQCYYYVLKSNNIDFFQYLKQLDSCYNYEHFSETGPVNFFFECFSNRNNIDIEKKTIGDLIFINKSNQRFDSSSCPNSSALSSCSGENNDLSSFLINNYDIYQVIPDFNKTTCKDVLLNKIQKISIKNQQLFINKNINIVQYPSNWSAIFDYQVFCSLTNNIEINIPIYLSSLDLDDFFLDNKNYSLLIRIVKENYYSFNFIIFYFDFQINIDELNYLLTNKLLKDIFKHNNLIKKSPYYIRGIIDDQNIKVKDINLKSIYDLKELIMI